MNSDSATTADAAIATAAGAAPAAGARLCARPFTLSSTPGKGSARGDNTPADYAEAIERLRPGFDVRVDRGEPLRWTTRQGFALDGLDPSKRHIVRISAADGKVVRQLTLDYRKRGGDDICLVFSDFYETWQLRRLRVGERCGPCVTR
ncbi:MAG: hypothetical protein R3A79_08125 [Nannocystaceae bacterium]